MVAPPPPPPRPLGAMPTAMLACEYADPLSTKFAAADLDVGVEVQRLVRPPDPLHFHRSFVSRNKPVLIEGKLSLIWTFKVVTPRALQLDAAYGAIEGTMVSSCRGCK